MLFCCFKVVSRSRRDLSGVFDALAFGVDGLANGMNTVSKSVMQAFDSVFSRNNLNAITSGLMAFRNGVKNALNGIFGGISKGAKKLGDKLSGAYTKENSDSEPADDGEGRSDYRAPRTESSRARSDPETTTKSNKFNGAVIIFLPAS